jgi:outer membrane protein assembly factor BamE (lipoprotein component of BamABCDE complex)
MIKKAITVLKKIIRVTTALILQTLVLLYAIMYIYAQMMDAYETPIERNNTKNIAAVEIGMTKSEVVSIMGEPSYDDKNSNQFSYTYNFSDYEYIYIYFDSKDRVQEIVNPLHEKGKRLRGTVNGTTESCDPQN